MDDIPWNKIKEDYLNFYSDKKLEEKYSSYVSLTTIKRRMKKDGILRPRRLVHGECSVENCSRAIKRRRQLCEYHYRESKDDRCSVSDCNSVRRAQGLCGKHIQRRYLGKDILKEPTRGRTYISPDGYVVEYMPGHIQADAKGKVLQHRRVMSEIIGRRLHSYENVHHRNGERRDNRPENLELWVKRQPGQTG